jgi:hypothetical protein
VKKRELNDAGPHLADKTARRRESHVPGLKGETVKNIATILSAVLLLSAVAPSQAYPTNDVLTRIVMVESSYGRGTIFSIDVDGREYWITAKHIVTGAEHPPYGSVANKTVSLRILDPNSDQEHWVPMDFSVIDPGNDIDIVALAPPYAILKDPLPSASFETNGLMLGADCAFLGFPYGGGWRATFTGGAHYWMPYVKHCSVSSLPGNGVLILDGINNPGFSGGPVLFQTGPNQRIVGVISGYRLEPAEVIASAERKPITIKKPPVKRSSDVKVNVNSGFIIAYSITPAIFAIRKNPIGPVRVPQAKP